jgi:NAD(P)-dependent dehydrogenase (short-subunit alcohol dehydrogenase family)
MPSSIWGEPGTEKASERYFEGKVVVITGSGRRRGIGYGIARHFARFGASVVVSGAGSQSASDSNYEAGALSELFSIKDELATMGGRHLAVKTDVTHPQEIERLLDCVEGELGGIDILVNNAGICLVKPLLETTPAEWENTIQINATGTFLCSTLTARRMIAQGIHGSIVNIASSSGKEGWAGFGAYTASKFAVIGFTQVFAREMAPYGIRVNAVCPGLIAAGVSKEVTASLAALHETTPEALDRDAPSRVPMGRYGTPEDVAQAVAFLVSPAASYITGQAVNVCGGMMVSH